MRPTSSTKPPDCYPAVDLDAAEGTARHRSVRHRSEQITAGQTAFGQSHWDLLPAGRSLQQREFVAVNLSRELHPTDNVSLVLRWLNSSFLVWLL
ncbi:hypothetical protein Ahy_B02g059924 isoform E [Arachis hypogaea]|uniref:Uncharacterized protein n=1 Tax=Arachis hypogaea TaxID=3818 RepID=A0A445AHH2_ARAHY|nr:hypothetical protein Ahy_B02g059924 isoform C [Arachis hypogaea]RYR25897.1 hypothetical protein Ahy_B02g059924 isoform E [Arachis hypogaea]